MKKLVMIILFITGVSAGLQAQKPAVVTTDKAGWTKIGEVTADFKMEKDAISVLMNDRFRSIRLKVTDAPIHIYDLQVVYESGETEDVQVRENLKAGEQTRVIDLKGAVKELKKVVLTYKTVPNRQHEKAHVQLWGLK